jgi:hypothetical protein
VSGAISIPGGLWALVGATSDGKWTPLVSHFTSSHAYFWWLHKLELCDLPFGGCFWVGVDNFLGYVKLTWHQLDDYTRKMFNTPNKHSAGAVPQGSA